MKRDLNEDAAELRRLAEKLDIKPGSFEKEVDAALRPERQLLDDQLEGPLTRLGNIAER
jgi:hypothetical protein